MITVFWVKRGRGYRVWAEKYRGAALGKEAYISDHEFNTLRAIGLKLGFAFRQYTGD